MEKKDIKTLDEAAVIAKALEPLGYEVYGVENTWYAGQVPGLVVKVIRVSVPQRGEDEKLMTREEYERLPPEQRDIFLRRL